MGAEAGAETVASAGPAGIVITGASSGIGEACAIHLDRQGFRIFAGMRNERDGAALRAKASPRLSCSASERPGARVTSQGPVAGPLSARLPPALARE